MIFGFRVKIGEDEMEELNFFVMVLIDLIKFILCDVVIYGVVCYILIVWILVVVVIIVV